ncbi:hypothetical protein ASPSYDRAFT_154937 [Aspergillus sydowii CBS 593.65]|uniref:Ketoreductase (KR) domain-containing protein n=1 Tax=Aspergillus sydowii CBS 593.65 TaxID=1036612 RepID=A0A1L9TCF8_9EURO|nr:uncharacterized protein ASPSYDRAFT_154937 [Aspergillus sydowii CBS 593.65]OJJ57124.1 hypothetical protein ASPSYDRAFT_154937 [Aspergillus sydowii CBS 593.65]
MVAINVVKESNASLKDYGPGLVGVFVGGTSGIGQSTARAFVRYAISPRVYLLGRNEAQASKIIEELGKLNAESKVDFVKCDVSLLKGVDEACKEIQKKEEKVNLLVMTTGMVTMKGRDGMYTVIISETNEGIDRKLSLHYYSRMRFISNLLPQLNAAVAAASTAEGKKTGLASVVSVLEAGGEGALNQDDLDLKNTYSLANARTHAITMNSLSLGYLAKANPAVSFIHSFPGGVKTGVMRELGTVTKMALQAVMVLGKPWMVPVEESGERHLYAAAGLPKLKRAGDESGKLYLVGSDGEERGNHKVLNEYREKNTDQKVWEHTLDVFSRCCE